LKPSGFIFLITYGLFYNEVSTYDYIVLNDELERLWKKWPFPNQRTITSIFLKELQWITCHGTLIASWSRHQPETFQHKSQLLLIG